MGADVRQLTSPGGPAICAKKRKLEMTNDLAEGLRRCYGSRHKILSYVSKKTPCVAEELDTAHGAHRGGIIRVGCGPRVARFDTAEPEKTNPCASAAGFYNVTGVSTCFTHWELRAAWVQPSRGVYTSIT